MNELIVGTEYADMTLEQIIMVTANKSYRISIFNNTAQVWNHTFYWNSLKPNGGGDPPAFLREKIDMSFGSIDNCKRELANVAITQFASGWAWLVMDGEKLKIVKTPNAEVPFTKGMKPLLTIDVWDHAY